MDCDDRARVGCGTYPEERLLEERAALGDGGVFGKSRLDLHLMPGAELARGGDHRVAQLSLGVGACGAEHGGDAGRGAGARDDTGRRAGGAEVRGGPGGGHFDLTETTGLPCVRVVTRSTVGICSCDVLQRRNGESVTWTPEKPINEDLIRWRVSSARGTKHAVK
jgi:hypothetical protein